VTIWLLHASQPVAGRLYLANGYMSTALDFSGGVLLDSLPAPCYVRGVYSDTGPGGIDRLTTIPCWSRVRYGAPAMLHDYHRELNLRHGIVHTHFVLEEARGAVWIDHTVLVSRADPHLAAIQMRIRPDFDGEITLYADLEVPITEDLQPLDIGAASDSIWLCCRTSKYGIEIAERLIFPDPSWRSEDSVGQSIVARVLHRHASSSEELIFTQLVEVGTSIASTPSRSWQTILTAHQHAWEYLWETNIEIDGDPEVQRFVRAGLFYLWSSVREGDVWSIPPMGLSSNGYNGHIFWDAEMWMFPALLITQPEMARSCLTYRERTLPAARQRATAGGYRGARFPWESAFTGEEMTPAWCDTRDFQLHITADVAIAQWWYFLNTGDTEWLRQHGFPVIRACAEFWASRVEYNATRDCYEITDVVCADEYAAHVNNDAFTNAAVRLALLCAARAAEIVGEQAPAEWRTIAEKIYIPYDRQNRRHLEFDGYDGRITKQADVELLAYPLEYTTDPEQVARDLDYYATVIDPNGPAMSFSIYAIVSAQLGRAQQAYEYLQRSYVPNVRPPFYAFSETPTNNEFLFCTGIGGALQAILYGFTGLRLREDHFVLNPILPEHWRALRLYNLFIHGARTDIDIMPGCITLRRRLGNETLTIEISRQDGELGLVARWHSGYGPIVHLQVKDAAGRALVESALEPHVRTPLPEMLDTGLRLHLASEGVAGGLDVLLYQPEHTGRPLASRNNRTQLVRPEGLEPPPFRSAT
jgi:trehalose/maltose hydrolase-like predicted phosphorylase